MRLVRDHRDIALHANGSDTGLPDHVKKQMVSGGTGSDLGQQWRTTFSSLKKLSHTRHFLLELPG